MGEKEPGTGAAAAASQWIRQNVLGLVAIFIALSGTALATTVASDGNQAVRAVKAKVKRGPPGPQGPAGAPGQNGSPDTGAQILNKLGSVDGSGSGLDADKLDNLDSTDLVTQGTEAWHELGVAGNDCTANDQFCGGPNCQWQNLGGNNSTGAYLRDRLGFVHLKGIVQVSGSDLTGCSGLIFVLPPGYRSAKIEAFAVPSNDALGVIYLQFGGPYLQAGQGTVWVSLDGISFRCEPSGSNGCP
jgi:hypothetical protein